MGSGRGSRIRCGRGLINAGVGSRPGQRPSNAGLRRSPCAAEALPHVRGRHRDRLRQRLPLDGFGVRAWPVPQRRLGQAHRHRRHRGHLLGGRDDIVQQARGRQHSVDQPGIAPPRQRCRSGRCRASHAPGAAPPPRAAGRTPPCPGACQAPRTVRRSGRWARRTAGRRPARGTGRPRSPGRSRPRAPAPRDHGWTARSGRTPASCCVARRPAHRLPRSTTDHLRSRRRCLPRDDDCAQRPVAGQLATALAQAAVSSSVMALRRSGSASVRTATPSAGRSTRSGPGSQQLAEAWFIGDRRPVISRQMCGQVLRSRSSPSRYVAGGRNCGAPFGATHPA